MRDEDKARLLGRCELFEGLPEEDLLQLAACAAATRYRRGQIVFVEGDTADALLVVVEGRLKVIARTPDGDELLLAVVGPDSTLGELALADGGRRSATVEALEDSMALRVEREAVRQLARARPALAEHLVVALARVVRRLTGAAADLVFLDVPRRLAKLLLEQRAAKASDTVDMALSQREIATRIGGSRQTVNQALREFERRGWIQTSGQTIMIRDAGGLRRFATS
ncbi:MAG: Crp/Fnr family transcriptional regulator [Actinomycetota bacterium]|nr:Crp/Fnr family transcriptional regulator [Actinomycetota bacterium]